VGQIGTLESRYGSGMGQVAANGIEITYDTQGDGERGTVLLVCGTGQPAAMWPLLGVSTALVEAGYRVVTFDNRGMVGAACPTPPWTVGEMADDAGAVLAEVGPAHVHGVSLGALITQTLAIRHPDLVRSATLMIGGGQFGPAWQPIMTGMIELYAAGVTPPKAIEQFLMLQAMLTPDQRAEPAMVEMATALAGGLTESFGPGGQHGQYSASATWITEDHITELATISSPVLVVANELDPIFPARGLRDVAAAVPNGTYVEIPGVSHVAMDPVSLQTTMTALVRFLAVN
jgi:pimeloyl-ACP methyl ester carboxylesterase